MSELSWAYLTPALPEIFLAVAALVLLIAGVFRGNEGTQTICWATMGAFALAAMFLLGLDWSAQESFNGLFKLDGFSAFMKLLVLSGLIASLAISVRYLYQENMVRFEYPVLVLLAGLGMMIMISANNMLSLYMGLELQSLALYVLAAIKRNNVRSSEAGIKYFLLGALGSGMLLFGMSLIYGYTGSLDFDVIGAALSAPDSSVGIGLVIGLVFLLVAMAFKLSAVPFHMWTPDVYEGAPTSVTALFAIVPKVAVIAVLIRLLYGPFEAVMPEWQQIIWFLAAASMTLGAFAAIAQSNIKRLLAYSSIGHMGYALIGVCAGTQEGVAAVILYMLIYMIMSAGVFSIVLMMRRDGTSVEAIEDLSGLSKHSPLTAYAMAILMFSMAGIPPMAGFFGKWVIFDAAVSEGFFVLAVIGVLTSVVAAYYYIRVIKVMFFDDPGDEFDKQVAFTKRTVLLLSVLFVLLFILAPDVFVETAASASSSLFNS